jgi:hypothetical protein
MITQEVKGKIADMTKWGAGAILTAWLGVTNYRVKVVEEQLYRCLEGKEITRNEAKNRNNESFAVLNTYKK